jgi:outer membrane protein OmpA-like peptidoglycan-associated protein
MTWLGTSVVVLLVGIGSVAPALAANTGFALDRFHPADAGSDWFALDGLDLRGHTRWAAGAVADYAYRPLVLYAADGSSLAPIVRHQWFVHADGSVVLFRTLKLGLSLPLLLANEGESVTANGGTLAVASGVGIGDLRLSAESRLYGGYGAPMTLAIATTAWLPTGSARAFTSDGYPRASLELRAAGEFHALTYAAATGVLARAERSADGAALGSEWTFAAALGVRLLDRRLLVGPEVWGATLIAPSLTDHVFSHTVTPIELTVGAHYVHSDFRFGVGVGPGLNHGLGTPALRVLAAAEWSPEPDEPPPAPPPSIPRPAPEPAPAAPVVVPAPVETDRDHDGVADALDACPDTPGAASTEPARNGCPVPDDRDRDGVLDADDACPDAAGPPSAESSRNGCPLVKVAGDRIEILERIEFENGSSRLKPASDAVLGAVLEVLETRSEIRLLEVQGHTDDRGMRAANRELSRRRAEAVVAWLVSHGVEAARLRAVGFGQDKPLAPNATEDGRQSNRRVEFHIVELAHTDAASSEGGTK